MSTPADLPKQQSKHRPRRPARRPHTNSKHTHVTDDDGWTHVVRGPAATKSRAAITVSTSTGTTGTTAGILPAYALGPPPLTSLAALEAEYARHGALLAGGEVMRGLRDTLEAGLAARTGGGPEVGPEIEVAVCVGLGSLSGVRRATAMRQLLAFEMVLEVLGEGEAEKEEEEVVVGSSASTAASTAAASTTTTTSTRGMSQAAVKKKKQRKKLDVYFQELQFTALDEEFLASRGYRVLHVDTESEDVRAGVATGCWLGPFAEYMMESTFFYAPHLELDVIRRATAKAVPTLYLGNNMHALDSSTHFTGGTFSRFGGSRRNARASSSHDAPRSADPSKEKEASVNRSRGEQGLFERWIRCADWSVPPHTKRSGDDSKNWASDFAYAFRRTTNVEEIKYKTKEREEK